MHIWGQYLALRAVNSQYVYNYFRILYKLDNGCVNTPITMPGNKEQEFIIMPKGIYVYIDFQMVIFNDLWVIHWPKFQSFPCISPSHRWIKMWFVVQGDTNLNKARIQTQIFFIPNILLFTTIFSSLQAF